MSEPMADRAELTESESQLLDLVRQGKVDAEIAVRLGLSNAEAKQRIDRLMWKLRARDRAGLRARPAADAELAGANVTTRSSSVRRVPLALAAFLVVVAAIGGVAAGWSLRGSPSETLPAIAPETTVATFAPTVPLPTATPYVTDIAGRQMELLGRPFLARSNLVEMDAEARETLLVVRFAQPVVMRYDEFEGDAVFGGGGSNGISVATNIGVRTILVNFFVDEFDQIVYGDDDSVTLVGRDGRGPTVRIWAISQAAAAYYHLELDASGRLYVATELTPFNALVAFDTGELLDIREMQLLGSARKDDHRTYCAVHGEGRCEGMLRGSFAAYGPGVATCDESAGTLKLASYGVELHFRFEGGSAFRCGGESPVVAVAPGGELPFIDPQTYAVTATARDGSPLSVVITRNGEVYVGEMTPTFGCPCRTGT